MTASPATEVAPEIACLPVVDYDHLSTFTNGDAALEAELVDLYMSSARGYLEAMREALKQQASWSMAAHGLKGASSNLGATRAAALAAYAEAEPPTPARFDAINLAVDDVASFFAKRLR